MQISTDKSCEVMKYTIGDKVYHLDYGSGTVCRVSAYPYLYYVNFKYAKDKWCSEKDLTLIVNKPKNLIFEVTKQYLNIDENVEFNVIDEIGELLENNPYKIKNGHLINCEGVELDWVIGWLLSGHYAIKKL